MPTSIYAPKQRATYELYVSVSREPLEKAIAALRDLNCQRNRASYAKQRDDRIEGRIEEPPRPLSTRIVAHFGLVTARDGHHPVGAANGVGREVAARPRRSGR